MTYELQKLSAQHQQVALLLAQGNKLVDVCSACDLNYNTWLQTTSSSLFKQKVSELREELEKKQIEQFVASPTQAKLEKLRGRALQVHEEVMESEDERVALSAATNVLEFSGLAKARGGTTNPTVIINISAGKLERMGELLANKSS